MIKIKKNTFQGARYRLPQLGIDFMLEQTASEIVNAWPEEKQREVATKLLSVARHGVKVSFPNLSTAQQVEDMNHMLDDIEERLEKALRDTHDIDEDDLELTGLEDLPQMTSEQDSEPFSEPKNEGSPSEA